MALALAVTAGVAIAGKSKIALGEVSLFVAQAQQGKEAPEGPPVEGPLAGVKKKEAVTRRPVLRVVPSFSVSERYDSNVFLAPGQGQNVEDFVTTLSPQVLIEELDRFISANLLVGATAETYVNNPELNYIAANAGLTLNLDSVVRRLIPRAGLQITDFVLYTPQPPAFLSPEAQAAGQSDIFARGIQPVRADSLQNTSTVAGTYGLSPRVNLQASYSHSFIHFGDTFATPESGGVFDTTTHSLNLGTQALFTGLDTINFGYTYTQSDFGAGSGAVSQFKTHIGSLGWIHRLTPTVTTTLTGGATWVDSSAESTRLASYTGGASLTWQEKNAASTLAYSRSVTPSYFVSATALISDVVNASLTLPLTARLSTLSSANYGRNESELGGVPLSFESYGVSFSFRYAITRWIGATASYSFNRYTLNFAGTASEFDRQLATLTINTELR